jgi:hypothetical protein
MTWIRNPNFVYRDEEEDGGLLFDPDIDDCYGLNLTAKAVWEHLEDVNAENYEFMKDIFDEIPDEAQLKQDVEELIKELAGINAIRKQ